MLQQVYETQIRTWFSEDKKEAHLYVSLVPHSGGAADTEIKVPSGENIELNCSSFKAWSRSAYCHTCYAYCQEFFLCLFLQFQSIRQHFPPKTSPDFFLRWL